MNDETRELSQIKIFLGFIVFVITILILRELRAIFIPFAMSLLMYFLFNGVVKKLHHLKIPKFLILSFLLLFIFILFYFFGVFIFAGVSSFIDKFPAYSSKITQMLTALSEQLKIPIADVNQYINDFDWSKSLNTLTAILSKTFGSFASFLGNLILVIIFLMFMVGGRTVMMLRIRKAFEEDRADQFIYIINSIENSVQHYLLIKIFVSLLTALIGGIIILVGGFDFVIFSAILIFVLNFIPNFGSVVATIFPITIGLIKYGFSLRVLIVAAGLFFTQMIIGNVVEPKMTGKNLDLSPIVILISLILWGWMWGIVGMILAVPITSAIKIICEHIDILKPIASLISAE
jgi:AI-2 transport protein TqsA